MYDINVLSLYEYEARMYAFELKRVDDELKMHRQAWVNHQVTAMKEQDDKQVPVYKTFKDFYDYEKALKNVRKENPKISNEQKNMAQIALRLNEGR